MFLALLFYNFQQCITEMSLKYFHCVYIFVKVLSSFRNTFCGLHKLQYNATQQNPSPIFPLCIEYCNLLLLGCFYFMFSFFHSFLTINGCCNMSQHFRITLNYCYSHVMRLVLQTKFRLFLFYFNAHWH